MLDELADGMEPAANMLQSIAGAADALASAKQSRNDEVITAASLDLCTVVQGANDRGMSWQSIGDALGICRGNAYQRFRRHPGTHLALRPLPEVPPL